MLGERRPKPPEKPITPKQERFCREYLVDLNSAAAARRAGFTTDHAYVFLQDKRILKKIEELQKQARIRSNISVDDVIGEYKKIAQSNMADYMEVKKMEVIVGRDKEGQPITENIQCLVLKDTDEIDPEKLGAIKGVKKFKDGSMMYELWDKTSALDKLGEHLGMFKQDITVHGNIALTGIEDMADQDKKELLEKVLHRQNNDVIEAEVDDYDNE